VSLLLLLLPLPYDTMITLAAALAATVFTL